MAGYAITPGYLETMGIDLLAGRSFGPEDGPAAEKVVLVNEAFVRTQVRRFAGSTEPWITVLASFPQSSRSGHPHRERGSFVTESVRPRF
jgi:hypothetical protein